MPPGLAPRFNTSDFWQSDFHLFTDASGSTSCDAWYGSQWFQVLWPPYLVLTTPTLRELYTIILTCAVWGQHWSSRMVLCHSDVAAVMHVYRLHARDTFAYHVLQCLAFSMHSMSAARVLSICWPLITGSQMCFRATMLPHSCTA